METTQSPAPGAQRINPLGLVVSLVLFVVVVGAAHWAQARWGGKAEPAPQPAAQAGMAAQKPEPAQKKSNSDALKSGSAEKLTLNLGGNTTEKQVPTATPAPQAAAPAYTYHQPAPRRTVRKKATPAKKQTAKAKTAKKTEKKKKDTSAIWPAETVGMLYPPASEAAPIPKPGALPTLPDSETLHPGGGAPSMPGVEIPDTVTRVPAPAAAAGGNAFYAVELNQTNSKYLADTVADTLKEHGFDNSHTVTNSDGTFKVKVGEFNFRYAAENAKDQLKTLGFTEAHINEKTVAE